MDLDLEFHRQLDGFRLDVAWTPRARRFAVLGPSGAGKSLLLRMIAGLERADAGHLRIGGRELARLPPEERRIAYVPQNYCLFPHRTVAEQLRFPAGAEPAVAAHWVERLGLHDLVDRLPSELSLGQQQRAALARALVRPADLMLLDEPFSALDAPLRSRLRREFRALQEEWNLCTILVTHDPLEAALLADEVLVISEGQLLQAGPFGVVVARPASELVARLLGAEQVNMGRVIAEDRIDIGSAVPLTVGGPALARGEQVGWSMPVARVRLDAAGPYEGRIESVLALGEEWEVVVRIGEARLRIVAGSGPRTPGDLCRFNIDPNAVQVWPV
jgi:molybdate transport system permease protein